MDVNIINNYLKELNKVKVNLSRRIDIKSNIKEFVEALKSSNIVVTLILYECELDDKDIGIITQGLKINQTIREIFLSYNKISDYGSKLISEAIMVKRNKITIVCLSNNNISDIGAKYISEAIKFNKQFTYFDLSNNAINNNAAKYLSKLIKTNEKISFINLSKNSIDCIGGKLIVKSLREKKSKVNLYLKWNKLNLTIDAIIKSQLAVN